MEKTIPGEFFASKAESARAALITRDGESVKCITRGEMRASVKDLAMGLISCGVAPGERVAIQLENCPEWIISDLAISSVGAISIPLYTTLGIDELIFELNDSSATTIFASSAHLEKIKSIAPKVPSLKRIVSIEEGGELTIEDLKARGRRLGNEGILEERLSALTEDDPFSIIYSSGTTGRSKGVILSHGNILSNIESVLKVIDIASDDLYLSYLPLSHVFERMVHHLLIVLGSTIAYSSGFAYVGKDTVFFRPSFMTGVPFFFERVRSKIEGSVERAGKARRLLLKLALERKKHRAAGARLLDRLVLKGIRDKVAPGLRFFVSGGAPLDKETNLFFNGLGLDILEGYGLTETSPVVSVNTPGSARPGTVGRPIPGVEVKIGEHDEILVKGPSVMKGYLNMPEETSKALRGGYFHTGDMGEVDGDGYLTITGRKKDLIVTSVGKNISPQRIETTLRSDEYVKDALVYGDGMPEVVALIIPDMERLEPVTKKLGVEHHEPSRVLADERVVGFYGSRLKNSLSHLAKYEQVRKFSLIEDCLSQESGELTPTMKIKRDRVRERFKDVIENMYNQ